MLKSTTITTPLTSRITSNLPKFSVYRVGAFYGLLQFLPNHHISFPLSAPLFLVGFISQVPCPHTLF
ncbi:hypothetical protein L6452_17268 [Arctium lappa]|uniref:Uncharacterized protein n=1 Tax=Arctium lappa TaxID=4217 RepID=A0ACB9C2Y0_ARCLA|nr:hypothetical protein L6452_17268 [Arctium lappa]